MSIPAIELPTESPRKLHEIESEITELAAHIHAATYRMLVLIREFDERDGWGGPGLRSCAHWLNWKVGISLGAAREKVRVADAKSSTVTGGDRCTINLHTTPDTLAADGETAEVELESGARVSAETSRRLACDCGVVHWHEDEDGSALNVGRKTRSIPPAIRRALQRRDQGCRFPGCTAHKYVDAHHITHWADGGETKMDNLVLLCRHHHRLVHEGGYGARMTPGGPKFTDPTGRTIAPVAETRFRGNVFILKQQNRRVGPEIGPETTIPLWEGERIDDGMAVEGLLQLE